METTEITRDPTAAEDLREAWLLLDSTERAEELPASPGPTPTISSSSSRPATSGSCSRPMPAPDRRSWMRLLPPDDAADVVQAAPDEERDALLALLDDRTRSEVTALLAYAEDDAGGLMSPRFARLRPDMTVDEAIGYLRRQPATRAETIYYVYVLDTEQHLLGVVSFRELFAARREPDRRDVMQRDVGHGHRRHGPGGSWPSSSRARTCWPSRSSTRERRMKGIVTVDDIVDVVQEEATEDIQKMGGMAALEAPYLEIGFCRMFRKRAGWLSALFLGEMLTATAMGHFEHEIAKAVVLALFIPLIISERRQLRLAGHHADHPRDGARRGPAARLVARRCRARPPRASRWA